MEINISQILFQIVNFGVVFGAVTYLLYKPLMKILDERRTKAEEGQKAAESNIREREEIETMKKKARSQAEKEASKILDEAREEAKALKTRLTKEIKDEVKQMRVKEMQKLEEEREGMRAQLESQVSKLSIAIASKVVGEQLDEKKHKALISNSIKELHSAL